MMLKRNRIGKTLVLYLLKNFWGTLTTIIFIFIFLVFFADLLDNLDDVISYRISAMQYLEYYLHTAPGVFVVCLPIAVLLSIMKVFRDLSTSNEYIALIMGGVSLKRMLVPLVVSCIALSIFSNFVSNKVAPSSKVKRKVIIKEKFELDSQVIRNRNLIGKDGRNYFISEYYKKDRSIKGLMITNVDENDILTERIFAEKLVWKDNSWYATNVKIQHYHNNLPKLPVLKDSYVFKSNINPEQIMVSRNKNEYLSNRRLRRLIKNLSKDDKNLKARASLQLDYYRRFSLSFLPIVLMVVGIPFSIAPIRTATSKSIGFGIIICIIYYLVDAVFFQAGRGLLIHPIIAAWIANVIFITVGGLFLRKVPH